jgi:hypothetical protein
MPNAPNTRKPSHPVSAVERVRLIAEAAYYRAEQRDVNGSNEDRRQDWPMAERDIAASGIDFGIVPPEAMLRAKKAGHCLARFLPPAGDIDDVSGQRRRTLG